MSTIIPYLATEAGPTTAQMLYTGYKDAKWAARKIQRAYRKRRSTKKRKLNTGGSTRVGEPMRQFHNKREQTATVMDQAIASRTLYQWDITELAAGTNREDQRERHLINCKGIQVAIHVFNTESQPKFFNIAIISPKHSNDLTIIDFFRGTDGARGDDFDTGLSALQMHYLPINTDKYTILKHQRLQLGAVADSAQYNSDTGSVNWKSVKMWIPVNRQLRYDNTLGTSCTTPIYLVYWGDRMRTPAGQAITANSFSVSHMNTMFYTDVV